MHAEAEVVESRRNLARVLREAGTSFDVIAQVLRAQSRNGMLPPEGDTPRAQAGNEARPNIAAIMRRAYASYAHIGEALGAFHGRSRQSPFLAQAKRQAPLPGWLKTLDRHTAKALMEAGYTSREEVRAALASGQPLAGFYPHRIDIVRKWLERSGTL